jgi:hypothetical protein
VTEQAKGQTQTDNDRCPQCGIHLAGTDVVDKARAWTVIAEKNAEIAHLRAQRDQLLAVLTSVARILAPGSRTFDDLMRDAMLACDRARAAVAAVEEKP